MLLDTSGLLCVIEGTEKLHGVARSLYKAASWRLTHGYVLAEFVTLADARSVPRLKALQFIADMMDNPDVTTVLVDETLHREDLELLFARPDKSYSLCDAVSFVLMRRDGLQDALTTDRHFEQEGFQRLLKTS